jgi:hypothetical protein
MKKSRLFTMWVPALALVLGLVLFGCENEPDEEEGGGTTNPLAGIWVDNDENPTRIVVFSDSGNNRGRVYYGTNLQRPGSINNDTKAFPDIFGTGDVPTYSIEAVDELVIAHFVPNEDPNEGDYSVTFFRREGSTSTKEYDMWLPDVVTTVAANRILVIIANGNKVYYSANGSWDRDIYEYRPDDNEIRWQNLGTGNPTRTAARITNNGSLSFQAPTAGAQAQIYTRTTGLF